MKVQTVLIVALPDDALRVEAWGLFGELLRSRTYRFGSNRRQWAVEQAKRWAEEHYLWFDEVTDSVMDVEDS